MYLSVRIKNFFFALLACHYIYIPRQKKRPERYFCFLQHVSVCSVLLLRWVAEGTALRGDWFRHHRLHFDSLCPHQLPPGRGAGRHHQAGEMGVAKATQAVVGVAAHISLLCF